MKGKKVLAVLLMLMMLLSIAVPAFADDKGGSNGNGNAYGAANGNGSANGNNGSNGDSSASNSGNGNAYGAANGNGNANGNNGNANGAANGSGNTNGNNGNANGATNGNSNGNGNGNGNNGNANGAAAVPAPALAVLGTEGPSPIGTIVKISSGGFHCGNDSGGQKQDKRFDLEALGIDYWKPNEPQLDAYWLYLKKITADRWELCHENGDLNRDFVCPRCGSAIWISFSNMDEIYDGAQIQLCHAEELELFYCTINLVKYYNNTKASGFEFVLKRGEAQAGPFSEQIGSSVVSGAGGKVEFPRIEKTGWYQITEINLPAGFVSDTAPIVFEVTEQDLYANRVFGGSAGYRWDNIPGNRGQAGSLLVKADAGKAHYEVEWREVWKQDYHDVLKQDYHDVLKQDYHEVLKQDYHEVLKQDYHEVLKQDYHEVLKQDYHEVLKQDYHDVLKQDFHNVLKQDFHNVLKQDFWDIYKKNTQDYFVPTFAKKVASVGGTLVTRLTYSGTGASAVPVNGGAFSNGHTYVEVNVADASTPGGVWYTIADSSFNSNGKKTPDEYNRPIDYQYNVSIANGKLTISFDDRLVSTSVGAYVVGNVGGNPQSAFPGNAPKHSANSFTVDMPVAYGGVVYLYTHLDGIKWFETGIYEFAGWALKETKEILEADGTGYDAPYFFEKALDGSAYFSEKVLDGTPYFFEKALDGAAYFSEKVLDGTPYFFEKALDGAAYFSEKVPDGTPYFFEKVSDGAANFFEKVSDGTPYFFEKVSDGAAYFSEKVLDGAAYYFENEEVSKTSEVDVYIVEFDLLVKNAAGDTVYEGKIANGGEKLILNLSPGNYSVYLTREADGVEEEGSVTIVADEQAEIRFDTIKVVGEEVRTKLPLRTIDGTKGADVIVDGTKGADVTIDGAKGADVVLDGTKGADVTIDGTKGADVIVDGTKGADVTIDGTKGADVTIDGTKGADVTIDGTKGADVIIDGEEGKEEIIDGEKLADEILAGIKLPDVYLGCDDITGDPLVDCHMCADCIAAGAIAKN
ncbi:MAG: SpaA isopeptide-forming pilin-related protein [Clostridiales bacterium]|nr:SpaA isopeptide-forming pilin-related protein [Clostridiales bacterium]